MTIPNDIARCHDDACLQRAGCLRWIERDGGDDATHHQTSFSGPGECAAYSPASLRDALEMDGEAFRFDFGSD